MSAFASKRSLDERPKIASNRTLAYVRFEVFQPTRIVSRSTDTHSALLSLSSGFQDNQYQ